MVIRYINKFLYLLGDRLSIDILYRTEHEQAQPLAIFSNLQKLVPSFRKKEIFDDFEHVLYAAS